MAKKTNERFSMDLRRFTFDADNPGTETRKTVALMGVIVIIMLIIVAAALYFLRVNLLSAGVIGSIAALASQWRDKDDRSP